MKTIGSFSDFKKILPKEYSAPESKLKAVQNYLESGGILKAEKTSGWPKIIYPTQARLDKQMKEVNNKIDDLNKQLKEWDKRHNHLKTNKASDMAKLATDPLYWEHKARLLSDPTYRKTYDLVQPPMHLIHRKDWRKRLKMFVRSKEYRIRLREARLSVIGKKRDPMKEEVEQRLDFNRNIAKNEKQKILDKKNDLETKKKAMKSIMNWTK